MLYLYVLLTKRPLEGESDCPWHARSTFLGWTWLVDRASAKLAVLRITKPGVGIERVGGRRLTRVIRNESMISVAPRRVCT